MKNTQFPQFLTVLAGVSVLAGAAHAAIINTDQTYTGSVVPNTEYYFTNSTAPGNTWTISGNTTVGNGTAAGNGRLFIGLRDGGVPISGDGQLTLLGNVSDGTDTLLLNGENGGMLGRLGHVNGGNFTATLNIDGGLAVTMGGRKMNYEAGNNTINILNGSLNYTTSGFGWQETGPANAFVNHIIGAGGSLILPGTFTDVTGFTAWSTTTGAGVEAGDITVAAASGLTLNFVNGGGFTTITAVPEPASAALVALGSLALVRRRRK